MPLIKIFKLKLKLNKTMYVITEFMWENCMSSLLHTLHPLQFFLAMGKACWSFYLTLHGPWQLQLRPLAGCRSSNKSVGGIANSNMRNNLTHHNSFIFPSVKGRRYVQNKTKKLILRKPIFQQKIPSNVRNLTDFKLLLFFKTELGNCVICNALLPSPTNLTTYQNTHQDQVMGEQFGTTVNKTWLKFGLSPKTHLWCALNILPSADWFRDHLPVLVHCL